MMNMEAKDKFPAFPEPLFGVFSREQLEASAQASRVFRAFLSQSCDILTACGGANWVVNLSFNVASFLATQAFSHAPEDTSVYFSLSFGPQLLWTMHCLVLQVPDGRINMDLETCNSFRSRDELKAWVRSSWSGTTGRPHIDILFASLPLKTGHLFEYSYANNEQNESTLSISIRIDFQYKTDVLPNSDSENKG